MSPPLRALAWPVLALALLAGCDSRPAPTAPVARLGPAIEEVFPAARSVRVPLTTPIWARFRAPLAPATVNPTTVFLKLDAARVLSTVSYDTATRTLRVVPLEGLRLRRTYTIELSPRIATADGVALDSVYFWQFTTTTLRRLEHPVPAHHALGQSPFAAFGWDATEPEAGQVSYELFTAADSATAALHAGSRFVTSSPRRVAPARLGHASTLWWSVRATNLDTGEQAAGPAWCFTTVAADAAIDSLELPVSTFCSISSQRPTTTNCGSTTFILGGGYNSAIRWTVGSAPRGLRLAGAAILLWPISATPSIGAPAVYGTTTDFDGCTAAFGGPPFIDTGHGRLAGGTFVPAAGAVVFRSDSLTAHVQSGVQFGAPAGYSLTGTTTFSSYSPASAYIPPLLRLYYYRDPPAASPATATRASPIARAPRR